MIPEALHKLMLWLKERYTVTTPVCSHDTKRNLDYVAACFLISSYERRPAQVTGNRKYLHGNSPTFHRSSLSWVRSHNETMSNSLPTPFAAITEIWFCPIAQVSSWTPEVYAVSGSAASSETTRKIGDATKKYRLLACKDLLEAAANRKDDTSS